MTADGAVEGPFDCTLLARSARVEDGRLAIGGCDVEGLAREFGTPLYVYDEDELRARCREYHDAFGGRVAYAAKAFLCTAMARLVRDEGLGLDVASGGEAHVALAAGFPGAGMVFHGNNKSDDELRLAASAGARIVVDSLDELDRIERLVGEGMAAPSVLVRVTPGVPADTHAHIVTGIEDSKFGLSIASGAAYEATARVARSAAMTFAGFHCHIGSQIVDLGPFEATAAVVGTFAGDTARRLGVVVPEINYGGGLGVRYTSTDRAPTITQLADTLRAAHRRACRDAGLVPEPSLAVEAGRAIVATAGITLYTVGTIKVIPGVRTYVAVDGGMSDNPRPVTYGARYEAFLPARVTAPRPLMAAIAGKHCEQGDVLVQDAHLPGDLAVGDVLATPVTGAYGHSMASTYNLLPRPAVVFVRGGEARVVVRRETMADLLQRDVEER